MCGIAGIIDLKGQATPSRELVTRMTDTLVHRGPDGSGVHCEPGIGFGHRRLSIVDLDAGQQPMFNADGSVCITFNGEIYNFPELQRELEGLGYSFRTRCDTEVIIHAWEEWGPACLERLNGMFAFAIWDRNRRQAFLARDRLGVKPLYYCELPSGELIFASELKALEVHPALPRRISDRAIEDYLVFGYVPDPLSIYDGVLKLEPGWQMLVDTTRGQARLSRYWDLDPESFGTSRLDEGEACEELRALLEDATRLRLLADVPLGAFLSGGVDSSAVVATMARIMQEPVKTCAIAFDDPAYDESAHARLVAEQYRTDHAEYRVEVDDFGLLDHLVDIYDEPYADSSAIPTYRVCEVARRRVTVALSGDAGDENFAGYRRYRMFMGEERARDVLPLPLRRAVFGPLGRWYPKMDWAPRVFRGKTTFQALARDSLGGYLDGVSLVRDELRGRIFDPGFGQRLGGYSAREVFERYAGGRRFPDALAMIQYLDIKTYLAGDILTKVDRASMAHSLEVRGPFLDYRLVEWAARQPSRLKLRRGEGKYLLKKALEDRLPHEILYRQKMGFAVPLEHWFRGPLAERVRRIPDSPALLETGVFSRDGLRHMVNMHIGRKREHSPVIWSLLMLEGFLDKQAGRQRDPAAAA